MAQNWHRKHIPSKFGFVILGLLLLSLAFLIPYLQEQQDVRSKAAEPAQYGPAGTCATLGNKSVGGFTTQARCQSTSTTCNGGYVDNYCGGGNDYKCCVQSPSCTSQGGKCITVGGTQANPTGGRYVSGYCPGPSNVKCYIPPAGGQRGVSGATSTPTPTPTRTPTTYFDAGQPGLKAVRYANDDLTGQSSRTGNANINVDFGEVYGGPWLGSKGAKDFSYRWEGYLYPPYTGAYYFRLVSDDGMRMWIVGNKIIDTWSNRGRQDTSSTRMLLTRGQRVSIKVEYTNYDGPGDAYMYWKCPPGTPSDNNCSSTDWRIVPTRQLAPLN